MKKTWYPQRHHADSVFALFRNYIHFLHYPLSTSTIEKDVYASENFPQFTYESLQDMLKHWKIESILYSPNIEQIEKIPSPSILQVKETYRSIQMDSFVIFTGCKNGNVHYLHTRKGFMHEAVSSFTEKWNKRALTVVSVNPYGEQDFMEKERTWLTRQIHDPARQNISIAENFLSSEECAYIINLASDKFNRSTTMGKENHFESGRTSFTAKLDFPNDEILNSIRSKAAALVNMPVSHVELFQCVSYANEQEYDAHYDTLDETSEKNLIETEGQRKYTMLAYLNDDFEGGETHFPFLDLLVQPKKGSILIFDNLDAEGKVMKTVLHAGKPVHAGQKFAMNIWVRTKPQF